MTRALNHRLARPFVVIALLAMSLLTACQDKNAPVANGDTAESTTEAENARATLAISPMEATMADTLAMELTIEAPANAAITWPDMSASLPSELEVVRERTTESSRESTDVAVISKSYDLRPAGTGEITIPPLPILIDDTVFMETSPIDVRIRSFLNDDDAELAPRKDIAAAPPDYRVLALGAGAGVITLGAVALAVFLIARRLNARAQAARMTPAHHIALERIRLLRNSESMRNADYDTVLTRLSNILRTYLEDRFGIHAPSQTTEEFLEHAQRSPALRVDQAGALSTFLHRCDLVKFADMDASGAEVERAIVTVEQFVEDTADDDVCVEAPA